MNRILTIIATVVLSVGIMRMIEPHPVSAQAAQGVTMSPQFVSAVSQCTWPSGATITNGVAYCFVYTGTVSTSGMYWAVNQSATWNPLVPPATAGGVVSVNGKTGVVTLAIQ
jgi:hypothetical protein